MDGQLVGQNVTAARRLDRIHVADDVRDRGRRASRASRRSGDRDAATRSAPRPPFFQHDRAAVLGDRVERIVAHLAAREDRDLLVEEVHELPEDAALGLPAQAEEDEVVTGEQSVHDLRDDGLVVALDPGEEPLAGAELPHQVRAHLFLDGAGLIAGGLELSEGVWAQSSHRNERRGHRSEVDWSEGGDHATPPAARRSGTRTPRAAGRAARGTRMSSSPIPEPAGRVLPLAHQPPLPLERVIRAGAAGRGGGADGRPVRGRRAGGTLRRDRVGATGRAGRAARRQPRRRGDRGAREVGAAGRALPLRRGGETRARCASSSPTCPSRSYASAVRWRPRRSTYSANRRPTGSPLHPP